MRGKIIHYNGNDGRGLIAADSRQFPFDIGQWRSDTAPSVNHTVEITLLDDALDGVTRVPDDVLMREGAGQLASKLGTAGAVAFQSIRDAAPTSATASAASGWQSLGKPLLIAHGAYVVAALLLPYVSIDPLGMGGKGFSLTGLSEASEAMGASVGGALWPWMAIFSIALPVFWRNRLAWLALLLPLFAALKPGLDLAMAASKASSALMPTFEQRMQSRMMDQMIEMLDVGIGAWVCVLAGLVIAAIGTKRVLLPPGR